MGLTQGTESRPGLKAGNCYGGVFNRHDSGPQHLKSFLWVAGKERGGSQAEEPVQSRQPEQSGMRHCSLTSIQFHLLSDFNISSVSGVLSPALAESLLMAVPPCQFTGANASIHIIHPNGTTGQ